MKIPALVLEWLELKIKVAEGVASEYELQLAADPEGDLAAYKKIARQEAYGAAAAFREVLEKLEELSQ